jgi:CBS domain-containing protein
MSSQIYSRITPEHTTAEAIEIMKDNDAQSVVVVDRDTLEVLGSLSRATLVEGCVRGWHEPERCRVANHLERS